MTSTSNKTPGNDGIAREFYIAFFDLINDLLMSSINYSWEVGELSTSQKQAVITLIEKKGKDKHYIQIEDLYHYQMWMPN